MRSSHLAKNANENLQFLLYPHEAITRSPIVPSLKPLELYESSADFSFLSTLNTIWMSYLSTLNTLLTSTTSRYTSLRRTLLTTSEDDSAIDDPESSHVSRVLRAYYTEKGRPFPAWLGPDPRSAPSSLESSRLGSLRGGQRVDTSLSRGNSGAGLSDLWADSPGGAQGRAEDAPSSLRRGLGGRNMGPRTESQQPQQENLRARPLPSQRAGSYQPQSQAFPQQQQGLQPGRAASPVPPGSSGGSVQERLKARLGGGSLRANSNSPVESRYDGGGSGGNPYEDRGGRARGAGR